MFCLLFVLFNLLVVSAVFFNFYYKRRKLPPGPTPLPLVGNMHTLVRAPRPEDCVLEWRRKYGDVYTMWMGEVPVVFFTEGELWREQRRFAMHVLRDFGMGKNLMQERVLQEVHAMFEKMNARIERGQHETNIGELIDVAVGSIINNVMFGYRFDDEHAVEFWEIKGILRELIQTGFHPLTVLFMWKPHFFRRVPYLRGLFDRMLSLNREFHAFFERKINARMAEIDEQDLDAPPTDFVEAFLKEKARRDANGEQHEFTMQQLNGLCTDLWSAGQETTSTTLAWGIAHLVHYPRVQSEVHAELDRVVGCTEKLITVGQKNELPYTNALICEIQRVANLLAVNVLHRTTREVTIDGYRIETGTAIVPQICAVLADEKIFDNPTEFRPERFLDASGKLKRVDELIPFSVGKRQCLGESLARMELFLFTANMLNQYQFLPGKQMPSLHRKMGSAIQCPEFKCRIVKRQVNI